MIVVNVVDLDRYDGKIWAKVLWPVIPHPATVHAPEPGVDELAVELQCDDERAKAIVATLRAEDDKADRPHCRAYSTPPHGDYTKI